MTQSQRDVLFLFLLIAIIFAAAKFGQLCETLTSEAQAREFLWRELPLMVDGAISRESDKTREILHLAAQDLALRSERQIAGLRNDLRVSIDTRAAAIQKAAVDELQGMRADLVRQIVPPSRALTVLLEEYRRIPEQVGQRLEPWTDCRGNGACWQAQATAMLGAGRVTLGETSRAMRTIREAAPAVAENSEQITEHVAERSKHSGLRLFFRGLK